MNPVAATRRRQAQSDEGAGSQIGSSLERERLLDELHVEQERSEGVLGKPFELRIGVHAGAPAQVTAGFTRDLAGGTVLYPQVGTGQRRLAVSGSPISRA